MRKVDVQDRSVAISLSVHTTGRDALIYDGIGSRKLAIKSDKFVTHGGGCSSNGFGKVNNSIHHRNADRVDTNSPTDRRSQ